MEANSSVETPWGLEPNRLGFKAAHGHFRVHVLSQVSRKRKSHTYLEELLGLEAHFKDLPKDIQ